MGFLWYFRNGVLRGVRRLSTAQARTEFRLRRLYRTDLRPRDFGSFYRASARTFWSKTWFYVTGAGDRMVLEDRNLSLRGRCKESDTLWKSWQAQYFVDVPERLAGVCRSKDCILHGRRWEFGPCMLCFEVEGLDSWEGLHFWNLNLRIRLRGISYDLGSWFRGRRNTSETCFHFVEVSQKTLVLEVRIFSFRGSLAENTRFAAPDSQFSRKSRRKRSFWSSGFSISGTSRRKRSFSVLEGVAENAPDLQFSRMSQKTLLLDLRILSFQKTLFSRQSRPFGSPGLQFSRKSRRICSDTRSGGPDASGQKILRPRSCTSAPTGSW